ncbi:MAG: STAS domain-containing protein [Pseudomonadota bacterium]
MSAASSESPLTVTRSEGAGCAILHVSGRVDHTNSASFLSALEAEAALTAGKQGLVVDLSGLEFITSAGLRGLILANKTVTEAGSKLALSGLAGTVADVFRISRFDTLFPIADSVDAASALVTG